MLGRCCYFVPELWYREIDVGPTSGQMSEKITFITSRLTDQKIDVGGPTLFISTWLWYRKTIRRADIWSMSEKMTFKTSRQTVRKLMLGQRCYFDLIMISQNYNVRPTSRQMSEKITFITKSANCQKIAIGPTSFRPDYDRCRKTDVGPTSGKRWPS